jgi:hypothetical protein
MTTIRTALLIALFSCGKSDDDGTVDPDLGIPCDAQFTLTTSDGTQVEMDECKHHGVNIEFANMDDATLPQPHNIDFIFRSSKNLSVDCWVSWTIARSCPGRTQYNMDGEDNKLTWNTNGCDVADSAKGEHEASSGSSEFTTMITAPVGGLAEGDEMAVYFEAQIQGIASDGTQLDGSIVIDENVTLTYTTFDGCSGSDGDGDEDGYIGEQYGGDDCNDEDPAIGPHAVEVCDEVDNNCDGQIDEEVTNTFYTDSDGDGYGIEAGAVQACTQPPGTAPYAGDCDDDDAELNPGQAEVCDGIDNDCDDVADEGTKIAVFEDLDGDGYGDDSTISSACPDAVPGGWTTVGFDCDDEDPAINPDGIEICDGVDNDCNSVVDDPPVCD